MSDFRGDSVDMMLSMERAQAFLDSEGDNHNDIHILLRMYVEREKDACSNLMSQIPSLVNAERNRFKEKSDKQIYAIQELIHIYGDALSSNQFVISTVHAVMAYFPDGEANEASVAAQRFFNRFKLSLKSVEASEFPPHRLIDSKWATEIAECNDYLKLVLSNAKEAKEAKEEVK